MEINVIKQSAIPRSKKQPEWLDSLRAELSVLKADKAIELKFDDVKQLRSKYNYLLQVVSKTENLKVSRRDLSLYIIKKEETSKNGHKP
jgi:hypothetical protein